MPTVIYLLPDGSRARCELRPGESVLDGALDNGIPGIFGQCGGACTCATCHCYVPEPFFARLPPPHPDEREMLEYVADRLPHSRLACQVVPGPDLGTLVVVVPERQA